MPIPQSIKGVTYEFVRKILHYDPINGLLTYTGEDNNNGKRIKGRTAGFFDEVNGYHKIAFFHRNTNISNIIWLWMTGEWPTFEIDHINRNGFDNRWNNLRKADRSLNCFNTATENKSSIRGVDFNGNGWRARITKNYKSIWLGRYKTKEEAEAAYKKAAMEIYGEIP